MRNIDWIVFLPFIFLFAAFFLLFSLQKIIEKWRLLIRIRVLQKLLPKNIFSIVSSAPFTFISNEDAEDLKALIDRTNQWIVPKLKATYFKKDPEAKTVIWLLKNRKSYETFVEIFGDPKYLESNGYFSSQKNEIVIDSTHCYGTLVHELVHAFIASNFRRCPVWFNEGLASLYNTCNEEGEILGLPDGSLSDIQSAILEQTVLSIKSLCALGKNEFYQVQKKINYAHAKYLCYYLQQQGLLKGFYRSFQKNCRKDPTGYETLQKIVRYQNMREFQAVWEQFMLTIPIPSETR